MGLPPSRQGQEMIAGEGEDAAISNNAPVLSADEETISVEAIITKRAGSLFSMERKAQIHLLARTASRMAPALI